MPVRASVATAVVFFAGVGLTWGGDASQPVVQPANATALPEPFGADLAGAGTTFGEATAAMFLRAQPNLSADGQSMHLLGQELFERGWHTANSFNTADAVGPLFNAAACQACHKAGGRGPMHTLLIKLSIPPQTPAEEAALESHQLKAIGDPVYGTQLQERAIPGVLREGGPKVVTTKVAVTLGDGTTVDLTQPSYSAWFLQYGPLHEGAMLSPRLGPPLIGLGMLEAVAPADIEALADPDDANGDGISGRPNHALDPATGKVVLGRFGWKASTPTLRAQTAAAFSNDIGVSTSMFPAGHGECTEQQTACMAMPTGVPPDFTQTEAPDLILNQLTSFVSTLGVPARRNPAAPPVLAGQGIFVALGCVSCHTPSLTTATAAEDLSHRAQRIWPYSDLLLHDMGDGLADNRPEGDANGSEWRTTPLWGLGMASTVGGKVGYLHDGRAASLTEAILWHGGEAQKSRDGFASLPASDRDSLMAFLGSL